MQSNVQFPLILITVAVAGLLASCATAIQPESLAVPKQIVCIDLKVPISASGTYGIGYTWITRLEQGPYWSEREDAKGTYFRAPPGGYSLKGPKGNPPPGFTETMDGGFYLPNDPNELPRLYRYFSTTAAPFLPASKVSDCSTARYATDPATSRVSMWAYAASGAAGGAAGGISGRAMFSNSSLSYGQAAGAGAAGGLIGGLIVASIINADVGKITPGLYVQDASFLQQLRALGSNKTALKHIQLSDLGSTTQNPPR